MVKGLDDLIRFLVDEIAIFGEQGASPSDYIDCLNAFYDQPTHKVHNTNTHESATKDVTIDREFQEQVWQWLTQNPEIRIGNIDQGNTLTLSEWENANSSHPQHAQPEQPKRLLSTSAQDAFDIPYVDKTQSSNRDDEHSSILAGTASEAVSSGSKLLGTPKLLAGLHVYTSLNRMWHAVAGHGPDLTKVPAMDFKCLSIIAARRAKGILQPDLVAISGQDKRSVPTRTERLHKNGYIEKRPVLTGGRKTSLLILKRFVSVTKIEIVDRLSEPAIAEFKIGPNDSKIDLHALIHGIFDVLKERKIITVEDLKRALGVSGHSWPMRVLARSLLVLEDLGCVKQVKAQAQTQTPNPFYFRCVKFFREPVEKEWQLLAAPNRAPLSSSRVRENGDVDAGEDTDNHLPIEKSARLITIDEDTSVEILRGFGRSIPQWTADRCMNNFLYDLIQQSGTQGISSMEIKERAIGKFAKRPSEYQLSRLVDLWQISQPLHLRHLAIIRDSALTKTVAHYVHYTYDNFKALVDSGKVSWEAVQSITPQNKSSWKPVAALSAQPELDDYGFPKLQNALFQGRQNDATPFECIAAIQVEPINAKLHKLNSSLANDSPRRDTAKKPHPPRVPKIKVPNQGPTKPKGRPRKFPRTGLPSNTKAMSYKEMKKLAWSQRAAVRYEVSKIENRIANRVAEGEDHARIQDEVLTAMATEHRLRGLEPPLEAMEAVRNQSEGLGKTVRRSASYLGFSGLIKLKYNRKKWNERFGKLNPHIPKYLPSIAAHSKQLLMPETLSVLKRNNILAGQEQPTQVPAPPILLEDNLNLKSKRTLSEVGEYLNRESASESLPSIAVHTQHFLRPLNGIVGLVDKIDKTLNLNHEYYSGDVLSGRTASETKNYSKQLQNMKRPKDGAFIGQRTTVYRRGGSGPRKSMLAIFRSPRLHEFGWFRREKLSLARERMMSTSAELISQKLASVDPGHQLTRNTSKSPHSGEGSSVPVFGFTPVNCEVDSESVSPYIDIIGSNRKLLVSSTETTDTVPSDSVSMIGHDTLDRCGERIDGVIYTGIASVKESEFMSERLEGEGISAKQRMSDPINLIPSSDGEPRFLELPPGDALETTSEQSNPQLPSCIGLRAGSINMLRKRIVMEILKVCDGVFPGDRELAYPFNLAWAKEGQDGTPEKRTITAVCKSLYASGKLRQLKFSFKNKQGVMVIKSMIIQEDIEPTDPRVLEIQRKMIDHYPKYYIPSEVEVSEDIRAKYAGPAVHGTQRSAKDLLVDNEALVQLEYTPKYLERFEESQNRKQRQRSSAKRKRIAEAEGKSGPGRTTKGLGSPRKRHRTSASIFDDASANLTHNGATRNGRLMNKGRPPRKVERLTSIRRPPPACPSYASAASYGVPAFDGSTTLAPQSLPQSYPDPSAVNSTYLFNPITQSQNSSLQISSVENTEFPADNLSMTGSLSGYHAPTNLLADLFTGSTPHGPSSCDLVGLEAGTVIRRKGPYRKKNKEYLPSVAAHTRPYLAPKRKRGRPMVREQCSAGLGSRGKTTKQGQSPTVTYKKYTKLPSVKMAYALNTCTPASIDPWYACLQSSTILDPDHLFHPATGTFSARFLVARTAEGPGKAKTMDIPTWRYSSQSSTTTFAIEVDELLERELRTEDLCNMVFMDFPFINHIIQHEHEHIDTTVIEMERLMEARFSEVDGRIFYKPLSSTVIRRKHVEDNLSQRGTKKVSSVSSTAPARVGKRKTETFTFRRLSSFIKNPKPNYLDHWSGDYEMDGRPHKIRRIRGPQANQSLGANGEKRLLTAVVVLRTLIGGIERHIDWVLVARLFEPEFDLIFIHRAWPRIMKKYRNKADSMQMDFQMMFVEAYEDGLIPPIDYDDLENYDWAWLVDWTMENIDTPSRSSLELPAKRTKFDDLYVLKSIHDEDFNGFYEIDTSLSVPARNNILHRKAFVYPLDYKTDESPKDELEQIAIAKTWIRANVVTAEANYHPDVARAKLLTFDEATIDLALKDLLAVRFLQQQNKGRLLPGRNYDISDSALNLLKKHLEAHHFQQAITYKAQLDRNFAEHGTVEFSPMADDGFVLAIQNMLAQGRIEVIPKDPPMNKFGLTDGGYETRKMDKSRLNFTVDIRPKPTYVMGNPLLPLPQPPSQHLHKPMAKIPFWYDIHDTLVPVIWEMVLAATMTVLAMRPGASAEDIEKCMRPSLGVWELDLVLKWMVEAGAARRTGRGFEVEEWWWMCLDEGVDEVRGF